MLEGGPVHVRPMPNTPSPVYVSTCQETCIRLTFDRPINEQHNHCPDLDRPKDAVESCEHRIPIQGVDAQLEYDCDGNS